MLLSVLLAAKSLPELVSFTFILGTAPSLLVVWMPFRALSIVLPSRSSGRIDDYIWESYQKLVLFFLEKLSPVEILFYGNVTEIFQKKETVLYISNHQSTVDWVVADMLAARQGSLGQIRFVLKDGLRFLPLYGYTFHQHDCIFVRRSRKFNSQAMEKNLLAIPKTRAKSWIVIFPEGTRFRPDNVQAIASSQNFARENDLTGLKNVLVPRTKAFHISLTTLRSYFTCIYDVTILYSQAKRMDEHGVSSRIVAPSMNEFMHGSGEQLHIVVDRIPVEEVPVDELGAQKWLHSAFERKDRLVGDFYERDILPGIPQRIPLKWSTVLPATLALFGLNALLWGTHFGRRVYLASALGGSILTVAWMGLQKVA